MNLLHACSPYIRCDAVARLYLEEIKDELGVRINGRVLGTAYSDFFWMDYGRKVAGGRRYSRRSETRRGCPTTWKAGRRCQVKGVVAKTRIDWVAAYADYVERTYRDL